MTKILAVHAHPDDIETLCAATLALLAAQGHAIVIATLTAGDCGSTVTDNAQTARIRKGEAAAAAAVIGAQYMCAEFGDLSVFNDDPSRRRVTELIRAAAPDLVITAAPADYHPDHETTSVLVRDACFAAPIPNYRTGNAAPLPAIPHLYFMDPIGGRDRDNKKVAPDFAVDVTAWFDHKRRMLAAHESQVGWVEKQHEIDDYMGSMETWTKKRGKGFGVLYAEGFRQYACHPYPASPLLQELVGGALLRNTP
ncbi:MAG TPA: PIG-L family deacetylase [Rhizomicrobium sp.]|jgi:LmbE family N-acetylglucosaminyl deacetylase|nr:PIG-L family deacetylase [Rhizomicrobium sp.]